ncbi:PIN domain-containing protein [Paractinoplanes hotanensis]|uniref:PIN domain-containing protein n=1 Tax=Paractinoplanes hotanensis TaxID=2906497 RepID=A0ABT0Y7B0_9ACTN|nr:PIN domain-containing protein [Actinoplanes hotanensis]MCM4081921.1 PIN domain-containing protein [Actinoplanes hotanensis]
MRAQDIPPGPVLVDTDVISYWVTGHSNGESFKALTRNREMAVSFATWGELLANFYRLQWGAKRITQLQTQLKAFVVVPYSIQVVELWARMHSKLSGHLHKGGTNDLWTAACALAVTPNLPIVTNNLRDFQAISDHFPDLKIIHPDL